MTSRLSTEDRWRVIVLWKQGRLSVAGIARTVGCRWESAANIIKNYKRSGNVDDRQRSGRPRVSGPKQDRVLRRLVHKHDAAPSRRLLELWTKQGGVLASERTVRRRCIELGLPSQWEQRKPKLSEADMAERLKFARRHLTRKWTNVLFTDETMVPLRERRRRRRLPAGEKGVTPTQRWATKVNVWGCMSLNGFGEVHTFTQNMDGPLYCEILEEHLESSAAALFKGPWILQEDNDPKHKSRVAEDWKREHHIKVLPWPARSPDLNPLENVWTLLKDRAMGRGPRDAAQLARCIKEEWAAFPRDLAKSMVASVPRRLKSVIAAGGGWTKY